MIEPLLFSSLLPINFPRCINGVLNVRVYIYIYVNISHGIIHRLQAFQEKIFVFFFLVAGGGGLSWLTEHGWKKYIPEKSTINSAGGVADSLLNGAIPVLLLFQWVQRACLCSDNHISCVKSRANRCMFGHTDGRNKSIVNPPLLLRTRTPPPHPVDLCAALPPKPCLQHYIHYRTACAYLYIPYFYIGTGVLLLRVYYYNIIIHTHGQSSGWESSCSL